MPSLGAVQAYQIDLPPALSAWFGSPVSLPAPMFDPAIVPAPPPIGCAFAKLSFETGARTTKFAALVAFVGLWAARTWIGPVIAPNGTVAEICVSELTLNKAATPPKSTFVVPVKLAPLICTTVPTVPDAGKKSVMVGAAVLFAQFK